VSLSSIFEWKNLTLPNLTHFFVSERILTYLHTDQSSALKVQNVFFASEVRRKTKKKIEKKLLRFYTE
jgi:hypothetical protein